MNKLSHGLAMSNNKYKWNYTEFNNCSDSFMKKSYWNTIPNATTQWGNGYQYNHQRYQKIYHGNGTLPSWTKHSKGDGYLYYHITNDRLIWTHTTIYFEK